MFTIKYIFVFNVLDVFRNYMFEELDLAFDPGLSVSYCVGVCGRTITSRYSSCLLDSS